MLNALAERYPHESEGFLQFVNVLVGDMTHSYAEEVVNYLDNLQTFTFPVNKENTSSTGEENELKAVGTLTSPAIVIISGTRGKILEFRAANSIVVRWAVRYSL